MDLENVSNAELQDIFYESAKDNDPASELIRIEMVKRGLIGEA
jgi:hypothetical protein